MKHLRHVLPLAALAFTASAAAALEAEVRADLGYDSNVFTLNDVIGVRDGLFAELQAGAGVSRKSESGASLGIDAGLAARRYESTVSDGDETRAYLRLRGDSGGKKSEHAFDWALRYRLQDSTYVSRFSGTVATHDGTPSGVPIGDRYDAGIGDARGAWRLPGGRYGRVSLEGSVESKDYRKDYAALGLDRLDYLQFGAEPRYEAGERARRVRIALPLARRQYRDRRVSDAAGNPVAGTDLEYTYYGLEARYDHALSEASELDFAGGYEIRNDNGVGYRDRKRWSIGGEWVYKPAAKTRVSAGAEWSSRVFDRPVTGDPTIIDETPEKDGYTLNARYAAPVPGVGIRDFSMLAEARWESFDNSNDVRFTYDRLEFLAGLRKAF